MNDDQEQDDNRLVGWILALAVVVAIAVSMWMGMWGALMGGATAPAGGITAAAPAVASAAIVEVDKAPAVATGGDYPETISLYFDSGKIDTAPDASATVAKIVAWSKTSPNTKIGISGYHDKSGDPEANEKLAKNRALVSRELLISAGVPQDRIIMVKPQSTDGGGPEDKQSRRVDIYPAQ